MLFDANRRIRVPGRSIAVALLLVSLGGVGAAGCKKAPPAAPLAEPFTAPPFGAAAPACFAACS